MDVVADFEHIENVYHKVTHAMEHAIDPKWGLTLKTHFSHWYDWGSMIYPRWGVPKGPDDLDEAVALHNQIIHAATMAAHEAGAVINDHHGVGLRLAPYMKLELGDAGMKFLAGLKKGVDPLNIMCPGKWAWNNLVSGRVLNLGAPEFLFREATMPTLSIFFGIVIRMFYNDHPPPHFHAEYQGQKATFTFDGNVRSRSNHKCPITNDK